MAEMKCIDLREFRDLGYLQEVNRLFLHPLGLALAINQELDGTCSFMGIWDYREDPEGIHFADDGLTAKAAMVRSEWHSRKPAREAALGYMVQPAGVGNPPHIDDL